MFRNGLEPWHLVVVLVVLILLFGSKKLPEMARGLGKSMRILKAETKAMRDEANADSDGTAKSTASERPAVEPVTVAKAEDAVKDSAA
jgi:sec-independent protein translocase protein TatA